jgi:hypothetical protein
MASFTSPLSWRYKKYRAHRTAVNWRIPGSAALIEVPVSNSAPQFSFFLPFFWSFLVFVVLHCIKVRLHFFKFIQCLSLLFLLLSVTWRLLLNSFKLLEYIMEAEYETCEFYAHQSVHRESIFKNVPTRWHFFCTVFYSLQTALHVSGETFTHHQELE